MLTVIKTQIEKTKQFVKQHPTPVTCALTAVVTWKISQNIFEARTFATTEMLYEWGRQNGILEVQSAALLDFIDHKALGEELSEFIINLHP